MKADEICRTAAELVSGDRAATHGDKRKNHEHIAAFWTTYLTQVGVMPLHFRLQGVDVTNMMELLKIARRLAGQHNDDDYIDAAGYAGIAGQLAGENDE